MADNTVEYKIKLTSAGTESVDKLKQVLGEVGGSIESITKGSDKLKVSLLNFNQAVAAIQNVASALGQVSSAISGMTQFYAAQVEAETKLQTVMRNTMNASDAEVQSIKDLCSAQQELGVIGDEVQLAGVQELATYASKKSSLETLIPVMNDMIAQQYGFNATQESAVNIATMMGKVFAGQTSALSRYGYTFSEAQEQILKFGTEEEKAATLAEVVRQSVGGVNAELAKTDTGRMVQLNNAIGDIKEQVGQMLIPFQSFITQASEMGMAASGIIQLTQAINATGIATKAWTAAQWLLNAALDANPIGIVVMALAALVGALVYAYNNSEDFRRIVDEAWAAVKDLASVLWGVLKKALDVAVKGFKAVVQWVKDFARWFSSTQLFQSINKFNTWIRDGVLKIIERVIGALRELAGWLRSVFNIPNFGGNVADDLKGPLAAIDALNQKMRDAADAKNALMGGGGGGIMPSGRSGKGGGKGEKDDKKQFAPETFGWYKQQIAELQEKQQAADEQHAMQLQKQISLLKTQLAMREALIESGNKPLKQGPLPWENQRIIKDGDKNGPKLNIPLKFDPGELKRVSREIKERMENMFPKAEYYKKVSQGVNGVASVMGNLGKVVGGTAGAWLEWGQNVLQAIASAIPQIMSLVAAQQAQGAASTYAAGTGAAASVSAIPIVGPVLAIAAVASVLAALASVPKYAEGGIAYGKTLGMFGEYANASTNPEVVAPLSKLRDLIEPAGGTGGEVVFHIAGRDLVGVLNKRSQVSRRTR
nr:MAG TPA: tail tape measure [Caudoviricetes sp.]